MFLSESNKEKETLYRELLIGVTRFFRDQDAFRALEQKVLPEILTKNKKTIRVWITGCSTGEEVYSVAILIAEYLTKHNLETDVKIFATDIDRYALDVAGQGFYSDSVIADVDSLYLTKYFSRRENGYQINESIRKMVVFASHNLIKDPPFSKLDLLVCRNLLTLTVRSCKYLFINMITFLPRTTISDKVLFYSGFRVCMPWYAHFQLVYDDFLLFIYF
ncbi:MAG TPA: hypothetical protein ENN84_00135 [Candidatus Marinimicrobia bacterium]|nr:hypothetical protein [Candidatus Neomarinimicrobiota bacterium]